MARFLNRPFSITPRQSNRCLPPLPFGRKDHHL
ncbi:hypothetical protein RKD22_001212 [Streptomyces pristinaespiralis]